MEWINELLKLSNEQLNDLFKLMPLEIENLDMQAQKAKLDVKLSLNMKAQWEARLVFIEHEIERREREGVK